MKKNKIYPFIETGIYKLENKITGEVYIGQSKNIYERYKRHIKCGQNPQYNIGKAIQQYGAENFNFEVLEYCDASELDAKEDEYILKYNSIQNGYNMIRGGQHNIGESNSNARLSEQDIYNIREDYRLHVRQRDSYEKYKDKITFYSFRNIWAGYSWKNIHMDVYTQENLEYYMKNATNGELSDQAIFTNDEVLEFRKRYINESAKEIYESANPPCKFQTFQQILWGRVYKDIPIYDKKNKIWINNN